MHLNSCKLVQTDTVTVTESNKEGSASQNIFKKCPELAIWCCHYPEVGHSVCMHLQLKQFQSISLWRVGRKFLCCENGRKQQGGSN